MEPFTNDVRYTPKARLMRARRLPARDQLRYLYHGARNLRNALVNAVLGAEEAELLRLQRAGRVVLGRWTYGRPHIFTNVHGRERLITGSYTGLDGTWILGGNHGPNRVSWYPHRIHFAMGGNYDDYPVPTGDTIVGSDVWTTENCLILPGVKIGDGAIVAAGAVVTKDVPPYAIVGGNPAKLIRYRFSEEQIAALLEIRWWEWPDEKVRAAVPWLESEDVDAFIEYARGEQGAPGIELAARDGSATR
jgi:acetyltransferase-like isoleucine patch superfamily enzyme